MKLCPFPVHVNKLRVSTVTVPYSGPCLSLVQFLCPVAVIKCPDKSHSEEKGLILVHSSRHHGRKASQQWPEAAVLSPSFHCLYSPGSSQGRVPPAMGGSSHFNQCKAHLPQARPEGYLTNWTVALTMTCASHLGSCNGPLASLSSLTFPMAIPCVLSIPVYSFQNYPQHPKSDRVILDTKIYGFFSLSSKQETPLFTGPRGLHIVIFVFFPSPPGFV